MPVKESQSPKSPVSPAAIEDRSEASASDTGSSSPPAAEAPSAATATASVNSKVVCLIVKDGIVKEIVVATGPVFTENATQKFQPNWEAIQSEFGWLFGICGKEGLLKLAKGILSL